MDTKDKLLEHHQDNDGIKEYDNPLPNWFVYLFYGCIVYAVLYVSYYAGNTWALTSAGIGGPNLSSSRAEYLSAVRAAEKDLPAAKPAMGADAMLAYFKSPDNITGGAAVYQANCIACHGAQGQGVVGPNLTDAYWIHGGAPEAVLASITHGYPDKGMPAWKPVLGAEKVRQAAAYVLSLHGLNVAGGKAPQGDKEP